MTSKPVKFSGRSDYFAVNDKTRGYSTSFRVSGRLGELAQRHSRFDGADRDCRRLNRSYEMGFRDGNQIGEETAMSDWFKRQRVDWIVEMIRIYEFINREHIERKFGVSTPQASLDLREAMKEHPNLITYNRNAKRYEMLEIAT